MQADQIFFKRKAPDKRRGFFYAVFAALLVLSNTLAAQAKLEVEDAVQQAGKVNKGEVVSFQYKIRNAGTTPLIITDAEVACTCTTVHFSKEPLAPGAATTITVSFDTKSAYGKQDRVVLLHSNDRKSPGKLRFKVNVLTPH